MAKSTVTYWQDNVMLRITVEHAEDALPKVIEEAAAEELSFTHDIDVRFGEWSASILKQ